MSNELIRKRYIPIPRTSCIVSKVGALRDDRGGWIPAQRPAELRVAVEENLADTRR